ncbi:hypothetical protein, partial [Leptospira santarosai]|uniref:hypothetical protein n=1 Tax=Leptospira santarosai TaxID=28183 RepID=UPI001F1D8CF7
LEVNRNSVLYFWQLFLDSVFSDSPLFQNRIENSLQVVSWLGEIVVSFLEGESIPLASCQA